MERRELEDIERFFASLGHRTPLAYYGLAEDAAADAVDAAIKKRRTWAQGQQANPKYRAEALFLIKSNAMIRRLLLEERSLYQEHFGGGNPALAEFDQVVGEALAGGWNAAAEATIRAAGRRLELEDALVEARMTSRARALNLVREADDDLGPAAGIDLYELLAVPAGAGAAELEEAYRARYRWARSLKDKERAGRVLAALDTAWRIVKDPARRAAYDAHRGQMAEATEEVERSSRRLGELLADAEAEVRRSPEQVAEALRQAARGPTEGPREPLPAPPIRMMPPGSAEEEAAAPVRPPLRMTAPTAPAGVPRAEPPGPPPLDVGSIPGRTIGLASGPQMVRERAPRLVVPVKSPVRLTLPRSRAVRWPLSIRNGGQGRMPGKVVVDVAWIVPERDWIDANAAEQELILELRPDLLDGNRGVGSVTVVTDHGERRTVHFEVERANVVLPLLGLLAVVAVAGGGWFAWDWWQAANAPPPPAVLRLSTDPPAGAVLVNGAPAGSGARLEITPPKRGEPFRLRVERAGFVPHEEMVTVDDLSFDRAVRLELAGPLAWRGEGEPAALDTAALSPLAARSTELAACFPGPGTLKLSLRVDGEGTIRGADLGGEGLDVEAGRACVERVLVLTPLAAPGAPWAQGELTLPLAAR